MAASWLRASAEEGPGVDSRGGGAGGKLPCSAGKNEWMPNPPKTKNAIASVIQKKNDGLNLRRVAGAAAVAGTVMANPPDAGIARFLQPTGTSVQSTARRFPAR